MTRLEFSQRVAPVDPPYAVARLDFDERQKVRNLVVTSTGESVGVFIERGTSLKHGDHLANEEGLVLRIEAAAELLSVVRSTNALALTRAAYHLGNRHMRLEIGPEYLAYQADPVLDEMVERLGLEVGRELRAFEPEPGAYTSAGHSHSHSRLHPGR